MANTLLTPNQITREALRILHQKLVFIGAINRDYDDSFAQEGAKIGDTLRIRLPNQYVVRNGPNLNTQDTVEQNITLQINTQKGVDLNFTAVDLTLNLDDFSKRILEPAMAILAAAMEADAFNMVLDVSGVVNNVGAAIAFRRVMEARKILQDNLAPPDDNRTVILNTLDNVDLVDALKGLFQDSAAIKQQYRDGMMGRTAGFEFYESTLMPAQLTGTAAAATGYTVNGAGQTGGSVVVATGSATFKKGDVVTFAGVNTVHPESKADMGTLKTFVVTSDYAGGAGTLSISPAIVTSGARQNVTASPTNGGAVAKIGGANGVYKPSIAFHKDAFTFASADLVMPKGVDMASRQVYDGISMRMVRAYDINNDKFPVRLDVLYGYKTLREQFAARILSN